MFGSADIKEMQKAMMVVFVAALFVAFAVGASVVGLTWLIWG